MFGEMGVLTTATFLQRNTVDISVYLYDHQLKKKYKHYLYY